MSDFCYINGASGPVGNAFRPFQWNDIVISNNVYQPNENGGDGHIESCWKLPIATNPVLDQWQQCVNQNIIGGGESSTDDLSPSCDFCFRGTFTSTNTVRAYAVHVLGTNSAFDNLTWGLPQAASQTSFCGTIPYLTGTRENGQPIMDLNTVRAAVGLPEFVGTLKQDKLKVHSAHRDCGASACYNLFTDLYLHDVQNQSLVPSQLSQYVNTVNGVNQNKSKGWNINVWHGGVPSCFGSATQATGAVSLGTTTLIDGQVIEVLLRRETVAGNNFAYLSLFYQTPQISHCFDVQALLQWMTSTATGPGTFETLVWQHPQRTVVANQMLAADPTKQLRRPADNMVLCGLQHGTEIWGVNGTNPNDEGRICFDAIGFEVGNQKYGKLISETVVPCIECNNYSIGGIPAAGVTVGSTYNLTVSPSAQQIRILDGSTAVEIFTTNGSTQPWTVDSCPTNAVSYSIQVRESLDCDWCTVATGIQCDDGDNTNCDCAGITVSGLPSLISAAAGTQVPFNITGATIQQWAIQGDGITQQTGTGNSGSFILDDDICQRDRANLTLRVQFDDDCFCTVTTFDVECIEVPDLDCNCDASIEILTDTTCPLPIGTVVPFTVTGAGIVRFFNGPVDITARVLLDADGNLIVPHCQYAYGNHSCYNTAKRSDGVKLYTTFTIKVFKDQQCLAAGQHCASKTISVACDRAIAGVDAGPRPAEDSNRSRKLCPPLEHKKAC